MKTTLKLSTLLVALASVFTFSSCMNNDNVINNANYVSYVTIAGSPGLGYTFYADFDSKLKPTTASLETIMPELYTNNNLKRAIIAFDLIPENQNGISLEKNKEYDIQLKHYNELYNIRYVDLPTFPTIKLTEASDTLITKNKHVRNVNQDIWAINGYLNAQLTVDYQEGKTLSVNTYYSDEDIDEANNKLTLNLYYNSNSDNHTGQGSSVFSFKLPEEILRDNFHATDTITLVLKAITESNGTFLNEVGSCKVAVEDFYTPMY